MLSCAGAYVSGAAGSNACPAGSVRIETEAACRTAATAAGKSFSAVETEPDWPRGCYTNNNNAFFNTHAVGTGRSFTQLLCAAGATAGAPFDAPPPHRRAQRVQRRARMPTPRVCCAALAGGVRNTRPA